VNDKKYREVAFKMHPLIMISMGGISQTKNAIKNSFSSLDSCDKACKCLTFKTPDPMVKIREDWVLIINSESKIQVKDDLYQVDSFYMLGHLITVRNSILRMAVVLKALRVWSFYSLTIIMS
jgi:hypothetical protein